MRDKFRKLLFESGSNGVGLVLPLKGVMSMVGSNRLGMMSDVDDDSNYPGEEEGFYIRLTAQGGNGSDVGIVHFDMDKLSGIGELVHEGGDIIFRYSEPALDGVMGVISSIDIRVGKDNEKIAMRIRSGCAKRGVACNVSVDGAEVSGDVSGDVPFNSGIIGDEDDIAEFVRMCDILIASDGGSPSGKLSGAMGLDFKRDPNGFVKRFIGLWNEYNESGSISQDVRGAMKRLVGHMRSVGKRKLVDFIPSRHHDKV